MAKEVILMPIAEINYENIIEYLISNWSIPVANDFIERFAQVSGFLSQNPSIYPFVDKIRKVQKCTLTKHNILYFVETEEVIKILIVFDTRQDPEKLETLI